MTWSIWSNYIFHKTNCVTKIMRMTMFHALSLISEEEQLAWTHLLFISKSFWVLRAPESWLKYFFGAAFKLYTLSLVTPYSMAWKNSATDELEPRASGSSIRCSTICAISLYWLGHLTSIICSRGFIGI